jgi:transposase
MIGPGANARVYLACGVTDMRKGIDGLAALVQSGLRQKPTSGAVFAFRGRRGDRIKLLTWDGQGFCLYYKVLEKGRFPWPSSADGTAAGSKIWPRRLTMRTNRHCSSGFKRWNSWMNMWWVSSRITA